MQPTPSPGGERWSINMPAVIGVVFVFLVGVVIWVIASTGDDDGSPAAGADDRAPVSTRVDTTNATTLPPSATTTPPSLSPTPLPSTLPPTSPAPTSTTTTTSTSTSMSTTTAPTTAPTTEPSPPVTTAPGADDGAVPGDLAVPGVPMLRPPCDGSFITALASAVGDQATGPGIAAVLDEYPGANYLRTDQACRSLSQDIDGAPIYVVFFGPFAFASDACAARADGPDGAYARELSDDLGPDHTVDCA